MDFVDSTMLSLLQNPKSNHESAMSSTPWGDLGSHSGARARRPAQAPWATSRAKLLRKYEHMQALLTVEDARQQGFQIHKL